MSSSTDAADWADWNAPVITEFRANDGKVGGDFDGAPLLLLHTTGAKTGRARTNPLMYQDLGNGSIAVFASKAGADAHPDWYHNISAHHDVTVEIGTETRRFRARTATGDERAPIWDRQKADHSTFADNESSTAREIPVVILDAT